MRLRAGMRCVIGGLAKRSDLNGLEAALLSLHGGERWAVRVTATAEGVRVKPANLEPCPPRLTGAAMPAALVREILLWCDPPAVVASSRADKANLRSAALDVGRSGSYRRRCDALALARWGQSRSIYGFVSLDPFQRHRPFPHVPGALSCADGRRVAHAGATGAGLLWDTAAGKMLCAFRPPRAAMSGAPAGAFPQELVIDKLALSSGGACAASVLSRSSQLGCTPPFVLVYDARGEDAEAAGGPAHVGGAPLVRGRPPLVQHEAAANVLTLGWVSPTRFVALHSAWPANVHFSESAALAYHREAPATQLWRFGVRPEGDGWATDWEAASGPERLIEPPPRNAAAGGLPEEVSRQVHPLETRALFRLIHVLATHEGRGLGASGDDRGLLHIWSLAAPAGGEQPSWLSKCSVTACFESGHAPKARHSPTLSTLSALAFSSSGRMLASAGSHDFEIRLHGRLPAAGAHAWGLLGRVSYRDAIATRPWFGGWQHATREEEEDLEEDDGGEYVAYRHELDFLATYGLERPPDGSAPWPIEEGAKHLLESMVMSGERMLVTGHRKGCVCVWDVQPQRAAGAAAAAGGGAGSSGASHRTVELVASLPPPEDRSAPTASATRSSRSLEPLTISDELIRGVAVVDTQGLATAGPAVVYSSRAGALTKLCTINAAELSAFGDEEWERYAREDDGADEQAGEQQAAGEEPLGGADGFRGAPWNE